MVETDKIRGWHGAAPREDAAAARNNPFAVTSEHGVSVGEVLARFREAAGLSLDEVADSLHIRRAFLEAIEADRPEALPGPVYALGFVRSYAHALGLDGEEAVRAYKRDRAGFGQETNLYFPEPAAESRIPRGAILLIALLLAILAYGLWYYMNDRGLRPGDLIPALSPEFSEMLPDAMEAVTAPASPVEAPLIPAEQAPAEQAPAPSMEAVPTEPAIPEALTTGPAAPTAPPTAPATGPATEPVAPAEPSAAEAVPVPAPIPATDPATDPAPVRAPVPPSPPPRDEAPPSEAVAAPAAGEIVVQATADSWIQVRAANGALVMTRILREGDSYTVPRESGLTLTTGNAGALEIRVGGRLAPPLGGLGEVRRDVSLDPERLLPPSGEAR